MAYATVSDVQAILQFTFSTTTRPTTAQVTQWIVEVDAEINAILRNHGFSPPVTDADSFLKSISAKGAAYYAAQAIYTGEGFNQTDRIARMYDEWRAMVKTLKDSPNLIQETSGVGVEQVATEPSGTMPPADDQRFTMATEY